jgi:hypothetical protein
MTKLGSRSRNVAEPAGLAPGLSLPQSPVGRRLYFAHNTAPNAFFPGQNPFRRSPRYGAPRAGNVTISPSPLCSLPLRAGHPPKVLKDGF